jgi:hypothetical protein
MSHVIEKPFRTHPRFTFSLGSWALVLGVVTALLAAGSSWEAASARNSPIVIDRGEPVIYQDGCHLDFKYSQPSPACLYGDLTSKTEVVLTGDSHAAQWFDAVEAAAITHHWKLLVLTKSSCPASFMPTKRNGVADAPCAVWQKYIARRIASDKPSRVIITAYSEYTYSLTASGAYPNLYSAGESKFIRALGLPDSAIYFIEDTPHPDRSIPDCLSKNPSRASACNFPLHRSEATLATRALLQRSGVHYLNVEGELCPANTCTALYKGRNTYRDGSHISVSTSKALAGQIAAFLN